MVGGFACGATTVGWRRAGSRTGPVRTETLPIYFPDIQGRGRDRAIRKYAPRMQEARRFDARPCPSDKFLAPTQLATHNRARAPPRKHSLAIRKIRTDEATRSTGQAAQRLRGNECARPARRKGLCRRHGPNQRCGGDDSGPHTPTRRAMRPFRRARPPHFSRAK